MSIVSNRRRFLSGRRGRIGRGGCHAVRCARTAGRHVALPVDVERSGADLQGVSGFLRARKDQHRRPLVIEPFAAGAVTGAFETLDAVSAGVLQAHSSCAGLLHRQGRRPRGHQRFRLRLPASAPGGRLVPSPRRPADAARRVRQVQRLSGRRELVGRGVGRLRRGRSRRWRTSRASNSAHRRA